MTKIQTKIVTLLWLFVFILGSCKDTRSSSTPKANANNLAARIYLEGGTMYVLADASIQALKICRSETPKTDLSCAKGEAKFVDSKIIGQEVLQKRNFFQVLTNLDFNSGVILTLANGNDATQSRVVEIKPRDANGDAIALGLSLIKEPELTADLKEIADDKYEGRGSGSQGNVAARNWLVEKFKQFGIAPAQASGDYLQKFSAGGRESANIIGKIEGNDPILKDQYIVIGAHMDHIGKAPPGAFDNGQPSNHCKKLGNDDICNGADDNASGTISVLYVARALMAIKPQLKRSFIIILFSGEELGLVGSSYYVNNAPIVPMQKTFYMINLDMVGYLTNNRLLAIGGDGTQQGAEIIGSVGKKYKANHGVNVVISSNSEGGSDHVPFDQRGVPFVFFNTGVSGINPNYHRASDSSEKINFAGMTTVAKIAFETAFTASNHAAQKLKTIQSNRPSSISAENAKRSCHELHHIH